MPYGRKQNYKGRAKQFTNVEELESQRKKEDNWRAKNKNETDDDDDDDDESESDDEPKEPIIEVHNPNRVVKKNKKIAELTEIPTGPTELSRREKEEIARQEATRRYQQLHAQGKTEEARADLARLAIIRKQREEAAQKREQEKKEKEQRAQAAKEASLQAIKSKGSKGRHKK